MKIKHLIILALTGVILPIWVNAEVTKEYCDNAIYEEYYEEVQNSPAHDYYYDLILGERYNRGKYKDKMIEFCDKHAECRIPAFGDSRYSRTSNMVAFALIVNNKPIFEALIHEGGLGFLADDGIYGIEESGRKFLSYEFETPAIKLALNGQMGVLEYLINNKDVKPNLLKLSGYIHYSKKRPQEPMGIIERMDYQIETLKTKSGYEKRIECIQKTKPIVEKWLRENGNKEEYVKEAKEYNEKLLKWAPKYKGQNDTPKQFIPVFDLFRLEVEENFAQNIDSQIDVIINNIMRGFNVSTLGNKA